MTAVIEDGTEYSLSSAAGGNGFILRFKSDRMTANLQGDDAVRFQADYETIKNQYPAWAPDQTLAQLWDQGGYSWLAVEDEVA